MGKKASANDAEIILKLYDLRREPELRKARNWWLWDFSPRTALEQPRLHMLLSKRERAAAMAFS